MKIFNSHVHTSNSPDCHYSADVVAQAAYHAGVSGISITDHCSASNFISFDTYNIAKASVADAKRLKNQYNDQLEIFCGIEFDEMIWCSDYAKRIIESMDFDIVLASVHKVRKCPTGQYFSRIDFSKLSEEDIHTYAGWYFEDVLETAKKCDFDVLSHLTIIARYICGKYGRSLDLSRFTSVTDEILKVLISRGKALEVNTSEVSNVGLIPDKEILMHYKALGGELVTIGTDAHIPEKIVHGFSVAAETLKECGFEYYTYYKNRKPQKEYI